MESLYLLIPLTLLILVIIVAVLFWAIRNGQFDDMEGPAHSILMDDDTDRELQQQAVSKKLDIGQNSSDEHRVISDQDKLTKS
jgi:cbb3-type cytochrome oxidase maturation protein